jgi:hypothetical protein
MGQRLLTETTLRPKATHIPRQDVPQRPFVSLFHRADFGSITLLRRPLLSYIRRPYLQMRMLQRLYWKRLEKFAGAEPADGRSKALAILSCPGCSHKLRVQFLAKVQLMPDFIQKAVVVHCVKLTIAQRQEEQSPSCLIFPRKNGQG